MRSMPLLSSDTDLTLNNLEYNHNLWGDTYIYIYPYLPICINGQKHQLIFNAILAPSIVAVNKSVLLDYIEMIITTSKSAEHKSNRFQHFEDVLSHQMAGHSIEEAGW